jgi:hypothetical protein
MQFKRLMPESRATTEYQRVEIRIERKGKRKKKTDKSDCDLEIAIEARKLDYALTARLVPFASVSSPLTTDSL